MIVMWKDEQFGLTFLSALNKLDMVQRGHGLEAIEAQAEEAPYFSARGIIFLLVYICIAVVTSYNFNLCLVETMIYRTPYKVKDTFFEAFTFLSMHLLMALLSAVVRTPKM